MPKNSASITVSVTFLGKDRLMREVSSGVRGDARGEWHTSVKSDPRDIMWIIGHVLWIPPSRVRQVGRGRYLRHL